MYATDIKNKMIILRLSPLGSISTVFSAAPSRPSGICQSTEKDSWSHLKILSLNYNSRTHKQKFGYTRDIDW